MWVDSIQIRSGKMTDDEMIAMGGPLGTTVPVSPVGPTAIVPETTELTVIDAGSGQITLTWPSISGHGTVYSLESSPTLAEGSWTTVPTTGNSATLPVGPGSMFFRLRY
jgi:hypothetical protein